MYRVFSVILTLALFPSVGFATSAGSSGFAVCRTLRNEARVECLGKHYRQQFEERFGPSSSSSSTSSVPDPLFYPDTYQDAIGRDKDFQPEGASCVRFTDERRALCRVRQLQQGTGRSASSSSDGKKVSVRRNCMRLSDIEKLKCLREARGVIDVITRTVK